MKLLLRINGRANRKSSRPPPSCCHRSLHLTPSSLMIRWKMRAHASGGGVSADILMDFVRNRQQDGYEVRTLPEKTCPRPVAPSDRFSGLQEVDDVLDGLVVALSQEVHRRT